MCYSSIFKLYFLVNRFRCPKGWRRLGGSCYYLSNLTSTSLTANHTCNHLHSNLSNLIEIQNTVELIYAAHVLTRTNLPSLMLSIDPKLLIGKNLAEMLTNDQDRWKQMKQKFQKVRMKYINLTTKVVERLKLVGLHMLRRSRKIKQSSEPYKPHETTINSSLLINDDEYEYDDLNSSDESDEFEEIENIRRICDQIAWNALNDNSTVYMLTTYIVSDKIVCSLSDVEPKTEYHHLCEYVLDFCFANVICGKHGHCINTLSDFKCSCSFLYGGRFCEKLSQEGQQILISFVIIIIFYGIIYIPIRRFSRGPHKLLNPIKRNLVRNIWIGLLSTCFLSVIIIIITLRYYTLFEIDKIYDKTFNHLHKNTIRLVEQCESTLDYVNENFKFFPFALVLIFIFSWLIKREKRCINTCYGRPGLLSPIEPFSIENRFTTATVFGIIAYEVLKIFEGLLFSLNQTPKHGVLFELFTRILTIVVIGLRYYPVLASLQLRNIFARFFACLYILYDIIYTIMREGSCMGFLPLSKKHPVLEEAKLREELGTWFIIYGLIKNIPHFLLLSYIGAELCVRFAYDSIYVPIKRRESIWSASNVEFDELEFSRYYVRKLLRRNCPAYRKTPKKNTNINDQIAHEHESKQQNVINQSCIKKCFNFFYDWDDSFHFTTIATCTYSVAFVVLYYLTCTFFFLYTSRTTGLISSIRSFIEYSANIELNDSFTLQREIIVSTVLTAVIYGFQLLIGMQNYKKHKLQLYKGIHMDIPSPANISWRSIVSHSVHYSGFLVGYMAWGFVICFHLILLILIGIRIFSSQSHQVELVLAIIVPILVVYLLKMLIMTTAGKFIFTKESQNIDHMKNLKTYAIFVYFSFFADCFLGIASCIIRLVKATFLNVVYMARLDCSFLGRPLEKLDVGYDAYVSYLHVEKNYSNPLFFVFCDLLLNSTKEELCTNVNNSNDGNRSKNQRENHLRQNTNNTSLQTYEQKNQYDKSIQNINHNTTDNQSCLSITETSDRNSQTGDSRKRKLRERPTTVDEIDADTDDSSSTLINSSTLQQQSQLSKSPTDRTKISNHENLSSKQDQYENLKLKSSSTIGKNLPQQQQSNKKKISKQLKIDISDSSISKDDDNSEGTGEISNTIEMVISYKQSVLHNQIIREDLSYDNTLVSTARSSKYQQDATSLPFNTTNRIVLKKSNTTENTKSEKPTEKYHQDTILTKEEGATVRVTTNNPSSFNSQQSYKNNLNHLRTTSSNDAKDSSSKLISKQSKSSSSIRHESNTNDDVERINNRTQIGISDRSHSIKELIPLITRHSNGQLSEQIETKQSPTTEEDKKRKRRKKIARTRWYHAYTIIHNSHLFELKKCLKDRLELPYLPQYQPPDGQLFEPITANQNSKPENVSHSETSTRSRLNIDEYSNLSEPERYIASVMQQLVLAYNQNENLPRSAPILEQENTNSPSFRPVAMSADSKTDNLSATTQNKDSSETRKPITYDQHMQALYQNEIKRFKKQHPHSYFYTLPYNYHKQNIFRRNAPSNQKIHSSETKNDNTKENVNSTTGAISEPNN
ncbi:unnamed protein product [Rotaria sp. Silwood2]|nr:unnamed protein product [Rotaria sp. Silwood2]CAF4106532.1 unnamed protein product [Rotaria sp. Silwood2]